MYDGKICGYELKDYQNYDIDSELDFFIIKNCLKNIILIKIDKLVCTIDF